MPKRKHHLDQTARELTRVAFELEHLLPQRVFAPRGGEFWLAEHRSRRALGGDVPVERWYLAEFFLTEFLAWRGEALRWSRYFRSSGELERANWRRCFDRCERVVADLVRDVALAPALAEMGMFTVPIPREAMVDAEEIYRLCVAVADRLRVGRLLAGQVQQDGRVGEFLERASRQTDEALSAADPLTRTRAFGYLHEYRCQTLELSWLMNNTDESRQVNWDDRFMPPSAWVRVLEDDVLRDVPNETRDGINRAFQGVVRRIVPAIGELGYDTFLEDVADPDMTPGADSPIGSSDINLIPSKHKTGCHFTLLALSKGAGKRERLGFPRIMQQVKTHLIDCSGITKFVIFVCDTWDAAAFLNEHFDELAAHYRRGVRFVFLMVGTPRTSIAPIAVNLGRPK